MLEQIKTIIRTRQECERIILQAQQRREPKQITAERIIRLLNYGKTTGNITPIRRKTFNNAEALRMLKEPSILQEITYPKTAKDINQLPYNDAEKWQLLQTIERLR